MLDLIHKILYTGIGFAALTEQKAQEIVAEMEKRGEVSSEEGKKLAQDLIDRARKQSQELRKTVSDEVEKILAKIKLASHSELQELTRRIEQLESKCSASHSDAEDSL